MVEGPPGTSVAAPTVDFRSYLDSGAERHRVLCALGYDGEPGAVEGSGLAPTALDHSERLNAVLHSESERCHPCNRTFVDAESRRKHEETVHVGKDVSTIIR